MVISGQWTCGGRSAARLVRELLGLEDGAQEEVLQLLVGVVDAQLLERVDLEDLEAEDVEEPDEGGGGRVRVGERLVDTTHEQVEDALRQGRTAAAAAAVSRGVRGGAWGGGVRREDGSGGGGRGTW